tara:strand:- start:869 stop:1117 length:249 start_codon:yes stop_codon:yes gene_type:complete
MELTNLTERKVEDKILRLFEKDDEIDIDLDYFDLTEEKEKEIKLALLKVGINKLTSIKNLVDINITWAQIRLCIILIRFELQ